MFRYQESFLGLGWAGTFRFVLLGLLTLVVACSDTKRSNEIHLILSSLDNPFFVAMRDGAIDRAKQWGYPIKVFDSKNQLAMEVAQIKLSVAQGAGVILLNPTDATQSIQSLQVAKRAGVPLITLDRSINSGEASSHIASDNLAGGRMAAEYMLSKLGVQARIVMLEGIPQSSTAQQRGRGFTQLLSARNIRLQDKLSGDFDRQKGEMAMRLLLELHPDLNGVFAQNDEMALGALKILAKRQSKPVLIGFDGNDEAIAAVTEGRMAATIAQQPTLIGSLGVDSAIALLRKEELRSYIAAPLKLITRTSKNVMIDVPKVEPSAP